MIANKFRVWSEESKKMFNPKGFEHGTSSGIYIAQSDYSTDYLEIMQCIGIEDINGKEIFEGDKVKHSEGINYIEYDEDSAMFVLDCYSGKPLHHNMPFEVIGNIYQNE